MQSANNEPSGRFHGVATYDYLVVFRYTYICKELHGKYPYLYLNLAKTSVFQRRQVHLIDGYILLGIYRALHGLIPVTQKK